MLAEQHWNCPRERAWILKKLGHQEAEKCDRFMTNGRKGGGMSGELGGNRKWQFKRVMEDHNKELKQLENFEVKQQNEVVWLGSKIINLADW